MSPNTIGQVFLVIKSIGSVHRPAAPLHYQRVSIADLAREQQQQQQQQQHGDMRRASSGSRRRSGAGEAVSMAATNNNTTDKVSSSQYSLYLGASSAIFVLGFRLFR